MIILSCNSDTKIIGIFDDKSILRNELFKNSDLSVEQVEKLLEEDRLELEHSILYLEEYKENVLEDYFSQYDLDVQEDLDFNVDYDTDFLYDQEDYLD